MKKNPILITNIPAAKINRFRLSNAIFGRIWLFCVVFDFIIIYYNYYSVGIKRNF